MNSVIVHGPRGCGKTLHAQQLRKHFGLRNVVDGFDAARIPGIKPKGTLYLTNIQPNNQHAVARVVKVLGIRIISFEDAMRRVAGSR